MTVSVVVMAAGGSTRYGRPKQLEPVGPNGESIMSYGIYDALRAGADRIILVTTESLERRLAAHLGDVLGPVPVDFVRQQQRPRTDSPWGTGHAVLAARDAVKGAFAVCNADDFYGREAWSDLIGFLCDAAPGADHRYAMVGYRLADTLTDSGGVSRALVHAGPDGLVDGVVERHDIRATATGIEGRNQSGTRVSLAGDAWVSMNLWGLTADLMPHLEDGFRRFLERAGRRDSSEFLLGDAIASRVAAGDATLTLLEAREKWFGLTHPADGHLVRARIGDLIRRGYYPDDLTAPSHD